jgi:hypothetical protein
MPSERISGSQCRDPTASPERGSAGVRTKAEAIISLIR